MAASKPKSGVGEIGRERRMGLPQGGEVRRREVDGVAIRHERPVAVTDPFGLHRPLHPPLQLDRLELRSEEPCGLPLENALEEPLQGGQGSHDRWRL